jgi:sugar/nucleoside kinase (ribokinase family)
MALEDGRVVQVPACPVEPLDTTGAGDSFNAGFLHAWLLGESLVSCLRLGAACGALSTLGLGGTARQPSREEAEAFLAAHGA